MNHLLFGNIELLVLHSNTWNHLTVHKQIRFNYLKINYLQIILLQIMCIYA